MAAWPLTGQLPSGARTHPSNNVLERSNQNRGSTGFATTARHLLGRSGELWDGGCSQIVGSAVGGCAVLDIAVSSRQVSLGIPGFRFGRSLVGLVRRSV